MEEMTQEQEQEYRDQVASEIWGESEPVVEREEVAEQEIVPEEAEASDPWAGVPPALRESIEALNQRVSGFDKVWDHLKPLEGRIGALQRDMQAQRTAAEQAAKQVADAPTKEQMAKAAQTDQQWAELKEEFPEWADALDTRTQKIEQKFMGELASLKASIPVVDVDGRIDQIRKEYEMKLLTVKHPSWKQTVATQEYNDWLNTQPQDIRQKALESQDALECIEVLDRYEKRQQKPVAKVAAERQQRLESSAAISGTGKRPVKSKSLDDMSPQEYRDYVAKQIWDS